ncbi:MAG: LTA synthase family protein [Candidatus Hydrogenedentota bacterium]|nr:MAG: LTA synthase family protein [Candidatus Hydrogenedentota bacterium]
MILATLAAVILPWTASIWIYLKRKSYFHTKLKELPLLSRYAFLFFAFCIYLFFLKPGHSSEQAVFSRNFSYEVAWSLFADRELENSPPPDSQFKPPIDSHLIRSRFTKKRNLVVIVLESTRADATSIYNPKLDTTPFLKQLAKNSIVALRGYSVNPHTSKCLVAIHCGIEPRPGMAVHEAGRGGLPAKCLPSLLKEVGYHTAYFQSPTYWFESRHKLVKNLKYDEFYPGESHPKQGFSKVNYFGYEDKIMLAPAEKWLKEYKQKNGNKPFLLTFLTNTSHHPYGVPKGWPIKQYVTNPRFNRYLNTVAYVDSFLKDLFDIFKRTRYYENTVFLITGDHGEAFYEHGFRGHSNHLYEETLRIPVLIHDPLRKTNLRIRKVVAEYDYLPTIIPFLGYQIENNHYRGINFMRIQKSPRNVYLSCWKNYTCLGFVNKFEKYIYWFNNRPDEYYHLQADPLEKKNLARETHNIAMYRQQTLTWYKQIKALYDQMGVRP